MRLIFFALLGVNVAVLLLLLTVWRPLEKASEPMAGGASNAKELQLVSEVDAVSLGVQVEESARDSLGDLKVEADLCVSIGPFSRLLRAEYFVEHLDALEVTAKVHELEVSDGAGFWVHLPSAPTRKQALAKLREVQAKKIDSYLIPKGVLANGISLGMFTQSNLADLRKKEMRALGYDAEIKEIDRTRNEVWVILNQLDAQEIGQDGWLKLMSKEKDIEKRQILCSGIASE